MSDVCDFLHELKQAAASTASCTALITSWRTSYYVLVARAIFATSGWYHWFPKIGGRDGATQHVTTY